jgi:hypothetical protein
LAFIRNNERLFLCPKGETKMPEYEVRIKETLERVVTVEATSRSHAQHVAEAVAT